MLGCRQPDVWSLRSARWLAAIEPCGIVELRSFAAGIRRDQAA